jgi:SAM-dependent methyltransferase
MFNQPLSNTPSMLKGRNVNTDYISVTEVAGDDVTREQVDRLCNRYYWTANYCKDKDVLEVACGTGQGLGYLSGVARTIEAGDYSGAILSIARQHYGNRIRLIQLDAQEIPYKDNSKDVLILFEAIYYLPNVEKFIQECVRVLRKGGMLLISTANKDLYDFNPSPFSHKYYGVKELNEMFSIYGFKSEIFGDTPIYNVSIQQRILRPIKKIIVMLRLMPKTTSGKKFLKRIVFGNLVKMPTEINSKTSSYVKPRKIDPKIPDTIHKVIYCAATLS